MSDAYSFALGAALGNNSSPFEWKTKQQGVATHLVAAFDPSIASEWSISILYVVSLLIHSLDYNGGYLENCTVYKPIKPWASDPEGARKLWILSEEMVEERFTF